MPILSRPPRRVPASTRLVVALGHQLMWLGCVLLAMGATFVGIFAMNADLSSWLEFRGPLETAPGRITKSERTRASVGGGRRKPGTPIYAHQYEFEFEGRRYGGVSYCTSGGLLEGQAMMVEFVPGQPEKSRVRGMRRAMFGPGAALTLVFPVVGLGMVMAALVRARRQLRLLVHGEVATGRLVNEEATSLQVDKRPVLKLTFEFTDWRGEPRHAVVRTHQVERLKDEPYERLFYDPQDPARAVLLDALPGGVSFGPDGELQPAGWWRGVLVLLPPALALGVCAAVFGLKLIG